MTIEECWEKYKHLDYLLLDGEWMDASGSENELKALLAILYDCWQAIREVPRSYATHGSNARTRENFVSDSYDARKLAEEYGEEEVHGEVGCH